MFVQYKTHMSLDLCHQLKGKRVVYVLQCAPDEQGNECRYVGATTNVERRTAEHLGLLSGGAAWCQKHKPVTVLECRVVNTEEEAAVMENMLFNVHASQVGYQCCRGSRLNMPGPMRRPPAYMQNCREFNESPRSQESTAPPSPEPKTPESWTPPTDLPPCYEKLRDENGITEDKPPVQCPCFINNKDPTGQYRQLAALLPA